MRRSYLARFTRALALKMNFLFLGQAGSSAQKNMGLPLYPAQVPFCQPNPGSTVRSLIATSLPAIPNIKHFSPVAHTSKLQQSTQRKGQSGMRTLPYGKFSQKHTWLAMSVIPLASPLAIPSANKKLKSFATAHWDAPNAARPLAWRYASK